MLKAIIFDLDDTLLWDERSVSEALKETCDYAATETGLDSNALMTVVREKAPDIYASYDTIDYVRNIGIGVFEALWGNFNDEGEQQEKVRQMAPQYRQKLWESSLSEWGVEDPTLAKALADMFKETRENRAYLYEETLDVLNDLQGKYKLFMLTNGSPDLQRTKLALSPELEPYFDDIVISGDFGSGKPDPAIFTTLLEKHSIKEEEAIMVGDNLLTDILGANQVGIDSVWINHKQIEAKKANPTFTISRLKDVLMIIKDLSK